jgi:hypothetical protein
MSALIDEKMAEAELREIIEEALEDGAVEPKESVPIYTHFYALDIIMSTVPRAGSSCRYQTHFCAVSLPSRASCKYSGNLLFHLHAEPEFC